MYGEPGFALCPTCKGTRAAPGELSREQWATLLSRWSAEESGEARLICVVIADGIVARNHDTRFFRDGGFHAYCSAIGLSPAFVLEQIAHMEAAATK